MFKKSSRVLFVTLLLFVLAGATYAFAASNTVPPSLAGDGEGIIDGYTVSKISYKTSGGYLDGVSFALSADAMTVQASLEGGTLAPCTKSLTEPNIWSCSFSGVLVKEASSLRVVAVQ